MRVTGEAHIENKDREFIYDCEELTPIDLDFDHEVTPGMPGVITVELDLQVWFASVNWEDLDSQGNPNQPIMIGGGENDETAALLRAELGPAFRVRD